MIISVDGLRVQAELETLATFSDDAPPAVTRVVFGNADRQARGFIKHLCAEAGLAIREDAVGNTFARWTGSDPTLPAVATGSHIDAIPHAGRYDGTVGVLGGLEAIRALRRTAYRPRRSIELVVFTSEEPTRFGIGCLGSRLLAGVLDEGAGKRLEAADGRTLDEWRTHAGFTGSLSSVRLGERSYAAFAELHIEQGPLLEREGLDVGVVSAIAAPASLRIAIDGEGGHAGALLMKDRHDAFLAAAEIALAVESAARSTGSDDTVGTVGVCDVFPGAVNSVPSRARLEVDVRDIDGSRRDAVLDRIGRACDEIRQRRGVAVRIEPINADAPARCDARVMDALVLACEEHGLRYRHMISRAYHDALFLSRVAPTAMLFIPCRDGVSHRPDEYASPEAIERGTTVLADALARLASE
jgi:N-carbamoyl-L-amino-acid hydrolase